MALMLTLILAHYTHDQANSYWDGFDCLSMLDFILVSYQLLLLYQCPHYICNL